MFENQIAKPEHDAIESALYYRTVSIIKQKYEINSNVGGGAKIRN